MLRQLIFIVIFSAVVGAVAGCGSMSIQPAPYDPTAVDRRASAAQSDVPAAQRLADDVWRTVRDLGWGLGKIKYERSEDDPQLATVEANVLLPDGRMMQVHTRTTAEGRVESRAFVEPFGDAEMEQVFLKKLGKVLQSPPRAIRGGEFDLPAWPGTQ